MKILKFGGTSVGSAESIKQVTSIIADYQSKKEKIIVVCSAMSGITNQLTKMAQLAANNDEKYERIFKEIEIRHTKTIDTLLNVKRQSKVTANLKILLNELEELLHGIFLLKELSQRTLDLVQSFGERLSTFIITDFLIQKGLNAEAVDSRELIFTNNDFGKARVDFRLTNKAIKKRFKEISSIPIVTGFIATGENKETTTLGRGGSDLTTAIIAAALKAKEIEIWSDVNGVMTTDPKRVKNAFSLNELSYLEAMEMSHFGAKIIYPPTLQPAFDKKIPLRIRNTFNPEFEGTLVCSKPKKNGRLIKGISSIQYITLISLTGSGMIGVTGVSSRLFSVLAQNDVNVILITQASSEHSICFAVDPADSTKAQKAMCQEFEYEIDRGKIDLPVVEEGKSVIAIIGENMCNTPGISGKLFSALGKNGINTLAIAQGSSEVNISVVIDEINLSKALNAVHQAFFISETKSLNIFMLGVGLIGKTLLSQIKKQSAYLLNERQLEINIIALGNSRKMLFNKNNINLAKWEDALDRSDDKSDIARFIDRMISFNLSNSIFVDCTSNEQIIKHYKRILASSISVVTPNKLANSGKLSDYKVLQREAFLHGVKFLYETNVGAGLPVINTMSDLKYSGDKILKIEGILSGTLSYIFNSFTEGKYFSDVVKEAKLNGFTEPDPRDDLNGKDVARKILILAREAGYDLEPKDVVVENILPQACIKAKSVEAFFEALENANDHFERTRKKAELNGEKLRFIASFESNKASVKLVAVGNDHPFYELSGSDNVIAFKTLRYQERPLVIKGPGAGAEVTAAGVFAEIISVSNYLYQGIKNILSN